MTEKERMLMGELYNAYDRELIDARIRARELLRDYNDSSPYDAEKRKAILVELLGSTGTNFEIEPPFHCDYGKNIEWGEGSYANFNCTILDCTKVKIGNNVLLGPNVGIYTAAHPIDPKLRLKGAEYAKPITIGDNV